MACQYVRICHQWGQRFQYGCRKCKIGQFKHRKCGRWVTAQYGFCPICYKDRQERLQRKPKIKKLSKPKGTMPKGYGQNTRYVFTDKPTMPKGWIPKK
jgi:hypothetical protein